MKAIFTLLATTAVAAATTLSGRTGQEPTAPPQGVPILSDIPVLGELFTAPATAPGVQEPTPAPQPTRARRRAPNADDERAAELDRLKARLAELEQQLAEREQAETARVRTRDRAAAEESKVVEEVTRKSAEQALREFERVRARQGVEADKAAQDVARRALGEAMAAQEKDHVKVRELIEHVRAEAENSADMARAEARVAEEHARAQALYAQAIAEQARQGAEQARASAEQARAQAFELRARAERDAESARARALETLGGLGYVDTEPEGASVESNWRRLDQDVQELARQLSELELEKGKQEAERGQLEKARVQLFELAVGGMLGAAPADPTAPRVVRGRVLRPDSQATIAEPRAPLAVARVRTPKPDSAQIPPTAPTEPAPPSLPGAPSAPSAGAAPVAPMPGAPGMQGRSGGLRTRSAVAPAEPGAPSSPRAGGSGSGGPINIHVENGDVHIHNGGGGAQISVEGERPFSIETTRVEGARDRVSGVFERLPADGELQNAFRGMKRYETLEGDGGSFEVSLPGDAWPVHWRSASGQAGSPEWADELTAYGFVDGDGAEMIWTSAENADVQKLWRAKIDEVTNDLASGAVNVIAPDIEVLPKLLEATGDVQFVVGLDHAVTLRANALTVGPGGAPAAEGSLDELLRLVREVHADVRLLREEMQTLRSEVENAPPAASSRSPFGSGSSSAIGGSGAGPGFGSGGGATTPSPGGASGGLGGAR